VGGRRARTKRGTAWMPPGVELAIWLRVATSLDMTATGKTVTI